ncbi:MAG: hypothetical protein ISF22_11130 [Methanomassiliicoccus sp.]|nr:hypothetical protein [Methanomassiliicoccus sp.]
MSRRSVTFVIIALMVLLTLAFASVLAGPSDGPISTTMPDSGQRSSPDALRFGADANGSIVIYFFYGSGCPHCALVEPYVTSIAAKYPQVTLLKLEVYHNSTNRALYQDFNARFNVKDPVVPSILIEDQPLIGEESIKANLEPIILRALEARGDGTVGDANTTDEPGGTDNTNVTTNGDTNGTGPGVVPPEGPDGGSPGSSTELTVMTVIVAALVDSINPCAISVMIFLLIFLTSLGDKRRMLVVGIVYIVTVYLVYFMAGLGLLAFLQSMTMTRLIYNVAAVLSIAIGLINIKDFIFWKDKATLAIPESRKPMIKKYLVKASIPAAVVLGVVVSLFELPCTGAIYFAILNLLGDQMTVAQGIPYLALYNLIFVLPLIAILAMIYLGVSAEKADSWRLENRRGLRLVIGLVMVALGAMMLLGVF